MTTHLDPRFSRWLSGVLEPLAGHDDWYGGLQTEALARVWRAVAPGRGHGWEKRAVAGSGATRFWLDPAHAEQHARAGELLLGFPFAWEGMDVAYVARPHDDALAHELFAAGHAAFCTSEGELVIRGDELGVYLDLEDPETREVES